MSAPHPSVQDLFKDSIKETLESLSAATGPESAEAGLLISALQSLYTRSSQHLQENPSEEFSEVWLVREVAVQFLQHAIEDNYVDIKQDARIIAEALLEMERTDGWFGNPAIDRLMTAYEHVATRRPVKAEKVELQLPGCSIIARMAPKGQPDIQVSSKAYPVVPILEETAIHPRLSGGLSGAFCKDILILAKSNKADSLCFIEKDIGPVGALSLFSSIVQGTELPGSIYRMRSWSKRSKFAGREPRTDEQLVIVYDLLVTGDGIQQVVKDLRCRFGARVVAAVVMFGYGGRRSELTIPDTDSSIQIRALGWYENLEEEIEKVRSGQARKTQHVELLQEDDTSAGLRDGHGAVKDSSQRPRIDSTKEETMLADERTNEDLGDILTSLDAYDHDDLLAVAGSILEALGLPTASVGSKSAGDLRRLLKEAILKCKNDPAVLSLITKICDNYELKSLEDMDW